MQIINPLVQKQASELEPGELFVTSFGAGYALAIMLKTIEGPRTLFAILRGVRFDDAPESYATELSGPCLSYGTNWVLEIHPGEETYPQNSYSPDRGASLFIDGPAAVLSLPMTNSYRGFRANFDLVAKADHELSARAAPVYNWSIWASEADRLRLNAEPIFRAKQRPTQSAE